MFKLFVLLYTLLPGQNIGEGLTHTITVELPFEYATEELCHLNAEKLGFRVHPKLGEAGVDYQCLQVKANDVVL